MERRKEGGRVGTVEENAGEGGLMGGRNGKSEGR